MGSKVSIRTTRQTKKEFEQLCSSTNRQQFFEYYLSNCNEAVCAQYSINLNTMYRLLKYFKFELTKEQLTNRNRIATEQRVMALHGVKNNFERKEVQELIKTNNKIKYGVSNQFQRAEIKNKSKDTSLKKYGVEFYTQTIEYHRIAQTKYIYDNNSFDSFPELATWIYAKDHGMSIIREPLKLEYIYDSKLHYYIPDFLINGRLIEIKGLQFFEDKDITKKMINPYDSSRNAITEAKHQCMIANDVKIVTELEYKVYVDYVVANYELEAFVKLNKRIGE